MYLTVNAEADEVDIFGDGVLVSDMQSDITIEGAGITDTTATYNVSGTLKYLDEGALVNRWGVGNFIALKFTNIDPAATSVMVGMDPSQGSGLVEIIDDPDKNGAFKVTDKDTQVFKVIQTDGTSTKTQIFNLSDLVLESA